MIASLKVSSFTNARNDDGITKEVMVAHQMQGKAGRWVKLKLNPDALEGVRTIASRARKAHYNLTLPWEDGRRLLPLTLRQKYQEQMDTLRVEFAAAVETFVAEYPKRVEESRAMHGKKWNPDDYPAASEIPGHFSFGTEFSAVPRANHLEQVVAGDALARMQADLEAANAQRLQAAEADVWERILAPVRDLATRLADPDAVFRDSLVGNVRDILTIAPDFNLTGKPALTAAVDEIKGKLASLNPDLLRNNMQVRGAAVKAAAGIIQRFGAVGVRKIS